MQDSPKFSRQANPDRQFAEIRPLVPVEVVSVLDAACINKGIKDRTTLVNQILLEWARRELHAANVLVSATRGNPALMDSAD